LCPLSNSYPKPFCAYSLQARTPTEEFALLEDHLHITTKYLSFLFLTAALTASVAPKAIAAQEVVVRVDHPRYYDRNHRDYHEWNDREDRSYRVYLGEHHRDYREFHRNSRREQSNYWNWRHSHPDHD
jgi:hypothetical protein